MAFNNYFESVKGERINFTSGFSTDLQQVLDDIDTNFQRILSAPFIQGDSGNSVVRETISLYEEGEETFTDFGKAFVKSLYNDDDLSTTIDGSLTFTFTDLTNYIDSNLQDSDITDGVYSCEYINPDPTDLDSPHITSVDCYMIENTISKTFVPIVFFVDLRIAVMQGNSEAWGEDFIDRSCVLYGACDENSIWDIKRYQVMPTLYFDPNVQQWCWALNNMETGVTAQGIQGDPGPVIPLWVANGVRYTNSDIEASLRSNVYLAEILSTNQEDVDSILNNVRDGDMVCVWFATDTTETSVPQSIDAPSLEAIHNFTIGLAKRYGDSVAVEYNSNYDFGTITDDVVLRTQLNEVGYDSEVHDQGDLRGLYVGCDGERLGQNPDPADGIHLIYSTQENSTDTLHITPTTYNYSYSDTLDNEQSALPNDDSLLCLDYSGIKSIPNYTNTGYYYDLYSDSSVVRESVNGKNSYDEYRVTLLQDNPKYSYKRAELGLAIMKSVSNLNPNEYIFLGGDTNNGNDQLLPGRYTYSGTGYNLDSNPAIQIIKEKQNIEVENTFDEGSNDRDMWNSMFNFGPSKTTDSNASYLNFSYRRHIGLSMPSDQHELSVCFTPKAEVINESNNRKWLRLYLPTVGYMRDATPRSYYKRNGDDGSSPDPYTIPNTYYPNKTYTQPNQNEFEPNWMEFGGLSIRNVSTEANANTQQDADLNKFYSNGDNELFLYDRVRFLVDDNYGSDLHDQAFLINKSANGLKDDNNNTPTTSTGWESSSVMKLISGWKPLPMSGGTPSDPERRITEAPVKGNKNNDYFDILLYDRNTYLTSGTNFTDILLSNNMGNMWNSYCYCNTEGSFSSGLNPSYFNFLPLLRLKLETPIILKDTGSVVYKLADELYISCIVAKGINTVTESNYNISSIEFSILFIDPSRFTGSPISNNRSIIKWRDQRYINDDNYVTLKIYEGRGNYFDYLTRNNNNTNDYPPYWSTHLQAIKDSLAINFVVDVKWKNDSNDWEIISIKPSSNLKFGHAEVSNNLSSSNFCEDRWIMSDNYIENGSEYTIGDNGVGNSNFYESFSWWMLNDLWYKSTDIYSDKRTYYGYLGLDYNKITSANRFYFSPNNNTSIAARDTIWTDDNINIFSYNNEYTKYYDFYEMEIGNTRFGTKPRRPELSYLKTGEFSVRDRSGNNTVKDFKLNYIYKSHEWNSWEINDYGSVINRNRSQSEISMNLLAFTMGNIIETTNRSLQIGQNNNSNLESVVSQLQMDDINVVMPTDSEKKSSESVVKNEATNIVRNM